MKESALKFAILFLLIVSIASSCDQNKSILATSELEVIESYIGQPFSMIENDFGPPDIVGEEVIAWVYVSETEDSNYPISKYEMFISWGDLVACYGVRYFAAEEDAEMAYASALAYMGEDDRTISNVGNGEQSYYTEDHRVSRRLDNMWEIDRHMDHQGSHVTLVVSDLTNTGCRSDVALEARRVEQKYGLMEKEEEDLLFHRIDY